MNKENKKTTLKDCEYMNPLGIVFHNYIILVDGTIKKIWVDELRKVSFVKDRLYYVNVISLICALICFYNVYSMKRINFEGYVVLIIGICLFLFSIVFYHFNYKLLIFFKKDYKLIKIDRIYKNEAKILMNIVNKKIKQNEVERA